MATPALDELPAWALELLAEGRVGRLGMLDSGGRPRVLPVTYALHEGAVWSAIDWKRKQAKEPARVRFLRERPEAALTVDRYDEDWAQLAWVQLLGRVEVLAEASAEPLCGKYPQYRERPPSGPFLRLVPERALCWAAEPPRAPAP